jgi:hypothetical protein
MSANPSRGSERRKPDRQEWKEAIHFGRMRCQAPGCDGVDLSDVDSVNEAIEKWNNHVRKLHTDTDTAGGGSK